MSKVGLSYSFYDGDGSSDSFPILFGYFDAADVLVYVDGVLKTSGTHYNITGGTTIVFVPSEVPPFGTNNVKIIRKTPRAFSARKVDWSAQSSILAGDMETSQKQLFYIAQEALEKDDLGV